MKTTIITGVSRGLGRALASLYLAKGHRVIGTSTTGRSPWAHENLVMLPIDLSDTDKGAALASYIEEFCAIKASNLILNAAVVDDTMTPENVSLEAIMRVCNVNLFANIELCNHLLDRDLLPETLTFIGSGLSTLGSTRYGDIPHVAPGYAISKIALAKYARYLAKVLGKECRVLTIDPFSVDTEMGRRYDHHTNRIPPKLAAQEIYDVIESTAPTDTQWCRGKQKPW